MTQSKRATALATQIHYYYKNTKEPEIHVVAEFIDASFEATAINMKNRCLKIAQDLAYKSNSSAQMFALMEIEKQIKRLTDDIE